MKREILIDSVCGRKRMAILEDGILCEMHYEKAEQGNIAGNIYTGRVMNVLPGMNAAFVDIGLGKNAFLHAGDIKLDLRSDSSLSGKLEKLSISSMVRPGQELMVQVVKEPGGTKGPRISSHITLPGHRLVLLPTMKYVGVSRKIEDEAIRQYLQSVAYKLLSEHGMGVIMRTASHEASEEDIVEEYLELISSWNSIQQRGRSVKAPALIHDGGSIEDIAIRDYFDSETRIITDDSSVYAKLKLSAEARLADIHLRTGDIPLFDKYSIDSEYEKALRHHVWLKSGGYLVIDHTEALTVIDVNTGKFIGKASQEDTILRTNTEAAREVARQLRLRDIGGIIIVDFIDMASHTNRDNLIAILKDEMSKDRNPSTVVGMTSLGLVELTRKKKRLSSDKYLKHACPQCGGSGLIDDFETIAWRIIYDLRRRHLTTPGQAYIVHLSCGVAGALIHIGAPGNMKVHVITDKTLDTEYTIEPVEASSLSSSAKLLRTNL